MQMQTSQNENQIRLNAAGGLCTSLDSQNNCRAQAWLFSYSSTDRSGAKVHLPESLLSFCLTLLWAWTWCSRSPVASAPGRSLAMLTGPCISDSSTQLKLGLSKVPVSQSLVLHIWRSMIDDLVIVEVIGCISRGGLMQ